MGGWRIIRTVGLLAFIAKRELCRRLVRTSERLVDVAERAWYAVLKASRRCSNEPRV